MPTHVTLAGELGIEIDGVAVDLTPLGRLGRLFWAFLVCERRRAVARDELAEVMWGEDELPRSWEQMLRGNASKLRAAIAAAAPHSGVEIVSAFGAYQVRLAADTVVDIEKAASDVERAATAVRAGKTAEAAQAAHAAATMAARGFRTGWSGKWVERRQAELRELRLRALEVTAAAACARRHWADAIAVAEEAVTVEPFRESLYQLLMTAHRGAGNPGEALRAYERCRRVLAEELGVNPSAATDAAYLAILQDEAGPASSEPTQAPLPVALTARPATFLVGRAVESERLLAALHRATTGAGQVVLIGGEPGIGKTALVAHFARQAHAQGATVLYGRGDEDVGVAFQPFAEALGHFVTHCDLAPLQAHIAAHGPEITRIAPELARRLPDLPPPVVTGSDGDRYRLFEAVTALVHAAALQGVLVIVLDDLHWAAPPTLRLLRHLLRTPTQRLLVVATYRHTEVGPEHPLSPVLADLWREQGVQRWVLDGLDEEGVSAFVEQAEGHALDDGGGALAKALHARTAGNPFFVGEFLRHLHESGGVFQKAGSWSYYEDAEGLGVPEGVRDVLARRLGRLSDDTNRVLTLGSVVGLEFELPLLERIAERTAVDAPSTHWTRRSWPV